MPDDKKAPPPNESEGQRINRELAEAAAEAEARQADEMPDRGDGWRGATVDGQPVGGAYLVDGVLVGPDGAPIKK
jgi:hypothetical protein